MMRGTVQDMSRTIPSEVNGVSSGISFELRGEPVSGELTSVSYELGGGRAKKNSDSVQEILLTSVSAGVILRKEV